MSMYKRAGAALGCALILIGTGCSQPAAPDTRAADEAAIRAADVAWSKASEAKQTDAFFDTYAEDANSYGPNMPADRGKAAIRKSMTQAMGSPGFSLTWVVDKVEAARSGDVGYSHGTYRLAMKGPKGEDIQDHGNYVTIWKKQADGKWKVVEDIATSEVPMPAPAK